MLEEIRRKIEYVESIGKDTLKTLTAFEYILRKLFRYKCIAVGDLKFGDAAGVINSDSLSAGEKQMLSFISYNGIHSNIPIFIDEPGLSLHVDWQRSLFTLMNSQNTKNQFIISTYYHFIYTKFPDKEISLIDDRGEGER
ncbi:MAG: AAA family ATPase [Acetobacteraceae bacterium]